MGNGTFVGLDVHARSVVAGLIDEATGEVRVQRAPHATDQLVGWLGALARPVRTAYEAGPTGYGRARALEGAGIACLVAAPGRIPRASGERVKNDARDAERLARLLRAGELVAVAVPTAADEGARDLVRAREDARADPMRARHRLSGATIGAYLGLTPSESQSGARHTRGPVTKTGNGHARRLLVEAAWHHRRAPRRSLELERRRAGRRPEVRARAEAAGNRLHRRWVSLEARRGLRSTIVAVAVARELAGWCWSLAVMDD